MNLENFPTNETAIEMMCWITGNGFYDNSYVGKWIFQIMGKEMEDAQRLFEELQEQIFPETATWGLIYHEQKYGIETNTNYSIAKRRSQILKQRNFKMSMNPERLRQLIENITGKNVEIIENTTDYTFSVKVIITGSDNEINEVYLREQINQLKPSHLSYEIVTERPLSTGIYVGTIMQQAEIMTIRQVM